MRRRTQFFAAISLVLGLSLGLLTSEFAIRVFGLDYGHAPLENHPIFHHWHPRSYSMLQWAPFGEYGGFRNYFNSEGFAMASELPERRQPVAIFLGDSFTEALQVPEEERFVPMVAKALGVKGVNFGCSSFAPILSRLQMTYFQEKLTPKYLFVQLFLNDFEDEGSYRALGRWKKGEIEAVPGHEIPFYAPILRRSHLIRFLRKTWLSWQSGRQTSQKVVKGSPPATASNGNFDRPLNDIYSPEMLENLKVSLRQVSKFCVPGQCEPFLFVIPDKRALLGRTPDYFHEYFVAANLGFRFIPTVDQFSKEDAKTLYFARDIHLTRKGHAILARALAQAVHGWEF